jgi:hypothetical protein
MDMCPWKTWQRTRARCKRNKVRFFAGKIPTVFLVTAFAHQNAARRREEMRVWTHILTCAVGVTLGSTIPARGSDHDASPSLASLKRVPNAR